VGEEVIVDHAEQALQNASQATGAIIKDYTAGPIYLKDKEAGAHEWIIEFETQPRNFNDFCAKLDETLREINSDYDAKRFKDLALGKPIIHNVAPNTFYNWMKSRGKLGGQNKVPRLSNDRTYLDALLKQLATTNKS